MGREADDNLEIRKSGRREASEMNGSQWKKLGERDDPSSQNRPDISPFPDATDAKQRPGKQFLSS